MMYVNFYLSWQTLSDYVSASMEIVYWFVITFSATKVTLESPTTDVLFDV